MNSGESWCFVGSIVVSWWFIVVSWWFAGFMMRQKL